MLFALAVIFVPMLLDGDDSRIPRFGTNVPPKPNYEFETLDISLEVPLDIKPVESIVVETKQDVGRLKPVPETSADKPSIKPSTKKASSSTAISKVGSTPEKDSSPIIETGPVTWVIQVGSFTKANNALALRDKLRNEGFAAFVEEIRRDKGLAYRVRVGPELTEDKAIKVKDDLKAKVKLDGLVIRHSG